MMLSTVTRRKPGVYFVLTSKCLYIPLLLWLCPDGQLWPTPQPGILLLCQLDSGEALSFLLQLFLGFPSPAKGSNA